MPRLQSWSLRPLRFSGFAHPFFELGVGGFEDEENVVDEGPGVVLTLVPTTRAVLKRFVIAFLIFFDQAFKADVAARFHSSVVALEQQQQAGSAAVAVAERVNAEEIEVERCKGQNRLNLAALL